MTTIRESIDELEPILLRMTDGLLQSSSDTSKGRTASALRQAVGTLMANVGPLVRSGGLTVAVTDCFDAALANGISLLWMDELINDLFDEEPDSLLAVTIVNSCIILALAQKSRIIAAMVFTNREAVDAQMARAKELFDRAKELAADHMDSSAYAALISLSASLVHHLVKTAQPLPRIVDYVLPLPLPALTISNRIYGVGGRSEEIVAGNLTVHPAFVRPNVRALSA